MPLLKSYLSKAQSVKDKEILDDLIAQGIKTDVNLLLDISTAVAKTSGRMQRPAIESLLTRIILPAMHDALPRPAKASDLFAQSHARGKQLFFTTGSAAIDKLFGGKGWLSGELSEICGPSGSGKTQLCLTSAMHMLIGHEFATVLWLDTLDAFSAERASSIARGLLQKQANSEDPDTGNNLEERVGAVLSRLQVYVCRDVYDMLSTIDSIHAESDKTVLAFASPKILVVDSLTPVLTGLLRMADGVGHATMMHASRGLRRLARQHGFAVLVTTTTVQLMSSEEQAPSLLMTANVKPGLGTSWKYATDLQLYLSRIEGETDEDYSNWNNGASKRQRLSSPLVDEEPDVETRPCKNDRSIDRMAEIMRSKRLKVGGWCLFSH